MGETKELRTLLKCYDLLLSSIRNNLDDIALFLCNKKIILRKTFTEVTDVKSKYNDDEKAQIVLRALENKIEEDETVFMKLLKYLFSKEQYSKLRDTLVSEFRKLGGVVETANWIQQEPCPRQTSSRKVTSKVFSQSSKKELSLKNIKKFLRENGFPSGDAGKLGEQLDKVPLEQIQTFVKNHNNSDWDSILTDILNYWLKNDPKQSWEKLGDALYDSGHKVAARKLGVVEEDEEENLIPESQMVSKPEEQVRQRKSMPGHSQGTSDKKDITSSDQNAECKRKPVRVPSPQTSDKVNCCHTIMGGGFCGLLLIACLGVWILYGTLSKLSISSKCSLNPSPAIPAGRNAADKVVSTEKKPTPTHNVDPLPTILESRSAADGVNPTKEELNPTDGKSQDTSAPLPDENKRSCTKIKSHRDLQNVLKEVRGVDIDRMCIDLKIAPGTCNTMERKNVFSLAREFMDQHPDHCWESIIEVLCQDFNSITLARKVQEKYEVPAYVYNKFCK